MSAKWTPPESFKFGSYTVGVDAAEEGSRDFSVATWVEPNDMGDGRTVKVAAQLVGYDRRAFIEIMRAVRSHAALVAALESLVGAKYDDGSEDEGELRAVDVAGIDAQGYELQECIDAARAALALAKGDT